MNDYLSAIGLMAAVTVFIRLSPLLFSKFKPSKFMRSYLNSIPIAVLTSLIFPQVFYSTEEISLLFLIIFLPLILIYFKLPVYLNLILSFLAIIGVGLFL